MEVRSVTSVVIKVATVEVLKNDYLNRIKDIRKAITKPPKNIVTRNSTVDSGVMNILFHRVINHKNQKAIQEENYVHYEDKNKYL